MKPILVSSGEPTGVGPDICLDLAGSDIPIVILGDLEMLKSRAALLNKNVVFHPYEPEKPPLIQKDTLTVWSIAMEWIAIPGQLSVNHSKYVMSLLKTSIGATLQQEFSALVTCPLNKAILNEAGYSFTGHTEYLAKYCQVEQTVMLLANDKMNVALLTTHLPLRSVPDELSHELIIEKVRMITHAFKKDFRLERPKLLLSGLNPHAGENGYLGREEIEIMIPAVKQLQNEGINIEGPLPADTLFHLPCDVYVTVYHDQGLSVIKYADFEKTVNITLGLPIIRTSVDHGTALSLAGTGKAKSTSLKEAVKRAAILSQNRFNACAE